MKTLFIVAVALAALSGCRPPGATGESSYIPITVTRSFRFYQQAPEQTRFYQHQFDVLSARFGFDLPPGEVIVFASFLGPLPDDGTRLDGACATSYCPMKGGFGLACRGWPGEDGDCQVRLASLYADLIGAGPSLLRLGLSEVLAGGPAIADPEVVSSNRAIDVAALLDDARFAAFEQTQSPEELRVLQATAADFTRYLIDSLGARGFADVYRSHATVADAVDGWRASAAYDGRRYTWNEPECTEAPLPPAATKDQWSTTLQMDTPTAIHTSGALFRFGRWVRALSFALDADSYLELTVSGSSGSYVSLESCEGPRGAAPLSTPIKVYPPTPGTTGWIDTSPMRHVGGSLPKGNYALYLMGGPSPGPEANVTVSKMPRLAPRSL